MSENKERVFALLACESCQEAYFFDLRVGISQFALVAFLKTHKDCPNCVMLKLTEADAKRTVERVIGV